MSDFVSVLVSSIDISQVRTAALAGSVVPVIVGLLLFRIIASVFLRAFIVVVALVLAGFIFLQRQEITQCVEDARAGIAKLDGVEKPSIDCKIFGFDLSVEP